MFAIHDENNFYKEFTKAYLKLCPVPSNSIAPEVERWKSKISKNFNAELCSKFVFFVHTLPRRLFVQHDAKPSFHRWGCTGVVGNMKAIQKTYYNTRKCQRRIWVIWRIAERARDRHRIVVSSLNQRWIMFVKCIFLESTLEKYNL